MGKHKCAAILFVTLLVGLPGDASFAQDKPISDIERQIQKRQMIYRTRPVRLDGPLRETNISDIEVLEIEAVTRSLHPGAIVNISGVTTGCPCAEGPKCEDQVWVVAYRPARSAGLLLSRIDGQWSIGPVQRWWLRYSKLQSKMQVAQQARNAESREKFRELWTAQQLMFDSFPQCVIKL